MAKKHSSTRRSAEVGELSPDYLDDIEWLEWKEDKNGEVALQLMEDGEAELFRENTHRPEAWTQLEKSFQGNDGVTGNIFGRVKGGFVVDLFNGANAFLPYSQVDFDPFGAMLLGSPQSFKILRMDRSRGYIVVSRRAVREKTRASQGISLGLKRTLANPWAVFVEKHSVGAELEGEVRDITEHGLIVGLPGDIDGMVHMSDIDWNRPGEEAINDYRKGDAVRVKVLDVDVEKERISLGIKQLEFQEFARRVYNRDNVRERWPQEQFHSDTSSYLGERKRPLWTDRRDNPSDAQLSPPEFIQKHYSDLISQGTLTQTVVRQSDTSLYFAYYRWRQNHPNEKLEFPMPKRSEVTEARYRERYGRAGHLILNDIRQEVRSRVRRHRQNKATRS